MHILGKMVDSWLEAEYFDGGDQNFLWDFCHLKSKYLIVSKEEDCPC